LPAFRAAIIATQQTAINPPLRTTDDSTFEAAIIQAKCTTVGKTINAAIDPAQLSAKFAAIHHS
jgi:hypothetical protein